jgi:hypothetical protein
VLPTGRSPAPAGEVVEKSLLADGSLRIHYESALLPLVEDWLPLLPEPDPPVGAARAAITVSSSPSRPPAPTTPGSFRFVTLDGWAGDDGTVRVWGDGGCHAVVDPAAAAAGIFAPGERRDAAAAMDVDALCTVASALLLGRLDRVLAHAGGVVDSRGGAWLMVGDSRSGKTTTCMNLVRAGWPYLSDDRVVLSRGADGAIAVEGWPKRFRVDVGWREGRSLGRRVQVDPREAWPGLWRRSAPLAGMLFPRVEAAEPTRLAPIHPADALARAVRAMPWLFFDPARAPALLALLRSAAALPAYEVRVGTDVYRDAERLARVMAPLASR